MLKPDQSIIKCIEILLIIFDYPYKKDWKNIQIHINTRLFNQIKEYKNKELSLQTINQVKNILQTIKLSSKSKQSINILYQFTKELVAYFELKLTEQLPGFSQSNLVNHDLAEKMKLISPINRSNNQSPEPMDSLLLPLKKDSNINLVCGIQEEKQVRFEPEDNIVQPNQKKNIRSKSFGENILKSPIQSQRQSLHQERQTIKTQESDKQDDNIKEQLKQHKLHLDKLLQQEVELKREIAHQKQMIKDLEIRQQQQKKKQLNSPQDKNKNKNYLKKRIEEFLKK